LELQGVVAKIGIFDILWVQGIVRLDFRSANNCKVEFLKCKKLLQKLKF
jgi:hypothetical protein